MKVQITRSKEYVQAQRIATGQNVPPTIEAEIDPAALSEQTRRILIGWFGEYPAKIDHVSYTESIEVSSATYGGWGRCLLEADTEPDGITPALIDALIASTVTVLAEKRHDYEQEQVRYAAEKAAQKAKEEHERAQLFTRQNALIDAYLTDSAARPTNVDTYPIHWINIKGCKIEREHPKWLALLAETQKRLHLDEAAKHAGSDAWIAEHGSARLKRLVVEGIEHDNVYLDERLAMERPGWAYEADRQGEAKDVRNARQEGLDLLDEARKTDPAAKLVWWVIKHQHNADCREEDGYCDKSEETVEWKGYACVATFLGQDIVYGVSQEYAV